MLWDTQNHSTKRKRIYVTVQVQFSLTLNIQNVGLSIQYNEASTTRSILQNNRSNCNKAMFKTHDLIQWCNKLILITNTMDNHAIITTIATFPLNNSKTHSHSIINSTYHAELSIQYKEAATILFKLIKLQQNHTV